MKPTFRLKAFFLLCFLAVLPALAAPPKARVLQVPFHKQIKPEMCGVAALEMVTGYYGVELKESQYKTLKLDARQNDGIAGATLEVTLRASGYYTAVFRGTLDRGKAGLYRHLDLGRPLIVMMGSPAGRRYLVVIGYNEGKSLLILLDPSSAGIKEMPVGRFKKAWARAKYFTLLAVPEKTEKSR